MTNPAAQTDKHNDANLLEDIIKRARKQGASAADAILGRSTSLNVTLRNGKTELIERSESAELGLRVFKGGKQAVIATSDFSPRKIDDLIERVLGMADATPEDPYAGIAAPEEVARNFQPLDLCDPSEPDPAQLIKAAGEAEAAAMAIPGITNTEGGDAGWGRSDVTLAISNGFVGSYARSSASISTTVLAGQGTSMERDYDYDSATYWSDLKSPAVIGKSAGERTIRRLNPRRVSSQPVPVIYEARQARDIISHILSAINGNSVARGSTFLKDKLGQAVCAAHINVFEDPFIARAPRSRVFDGEGLVPHKRTLIERGVLTTWLLDLRSARKLGLKPTGHAARGIGGPPSPSASNVWLEAGKASVDELIADIKQGLFLTDTLGHGTNMVTGDYSRGASGYWIENGKLAYPVSELTVAGNLADIFKNITPASDLERRYGVDSPTLRIDGMMVAGQ